MRWYVSRFVQPQEFLFTLVSAPPVEGYFIAPTTEGDRTVPPKGGTILKTPDGSVTVPTRLDAIELLISHLNKEKLKL